MDSAPILARRSAGVPSAERLAEIAERAAVNDHADGDLAVEVEWLRRDGVVAAPLPDGGPGVGVLPDGAEPCFALLRALGRASLPLARLVEGHVNAVKLVHLYARPATRERVFAAVRSGVLLGVWGADGPEPVCLGERPDGLVLSGAKRFASGLGLVGSALVTARTERGPQLVLVPADDPARMDRSTWRMAGMRASQSGTYCLSGLPVGVDDLVGAPGDYLTEPFFEGGTWRYCAAHLGGAEALYARMLSHLRAAGRADDPHQARRIAEAATACETARLWIEAAMRRVERNGGDGGGASAYALLAREATETACLTVMDRVERSLGMAAHDAASAMDRIRRDLSLFLRQAAPDAKRAAAAAALVSRMARPDGL